VLPADWTEVLGRVQQALEQAQASAAQRAEALAPSPPAADPELSWQRGLEQVRERLEGLSLYAERASRNIAAADAVLADGEEGLRRWLSASEAVRRTLAEWVGRAIG
jgi:hypothetical protein